MEVVEFILLLPQCLLVYFVMCMYLEHLLDCIIEISSFFTYHLFVNLLMIAPRRMFYKKGTGRKALSIHPDAGRQRLGIHSCVSFWSLAKNRACLVCSACGKT